MPEKKPPHSNGNGDGEDIAKKYMAKIAGEVVSEQLAALRADLIAEVGKAGSGVIGQRMAEVNQQVTQAFGKVNEVLARIPLPEQLAQQVAQILAQAHAAQQQAQQQPAVVVNTGAQQPGQPAAAAGPANMQAVFQDAIGKGIANFLADPAGYILKIRQGVTGVTAAQFDPRPLTLAQIKSVWDTHPDECEFIAQAKLPDPLVELLPQQTMRAYQMGAAAMAQSMRSAFRSKGGDPSQLPEVDLPEPLALSTPTRSPRRPSGGSTNGSVPGTGALPTSGPGTVSALPAGRTKLRDLVLARR